MIYSLAIQHCIDVIILLHYLPSRPCLSWESVWVVVMVVALLSSPPILHRLSPAPPHNSHHSLLPVKTGLDGFKISNSTQPTYYRQSLLLKVKMWTRAVMEPTPTLTWVTVSQGQKWKRPRLKRNKAQTCIHFNLI